MSSLFITGASGFVGRHVLEAIRPGEFERVVCLSRTPLSKHRPDVEHVRADLLDSDAYAKQLAGIDTVMHLAAATGNATAAEHMRVNAEGTALLVRMCEQLLVGRFLYVSSIAARFSEIRDYPYAQAKRQAEATVSSSELRYEIVRPTIVLGAGSPIGQRLSALARGRITPVFGSGATRIQPIDVEDLAEALLSIVRSARFENQVIELGGPEVTTMQDLLALMHRMRYGREPRVVHVPIAPVRGILRLLDRLHLPTPVKPGQLASFTNDGTVQARGNYDPHARMKNLREMVGAGA